MLSSSLLEQLEVYLTSFQVDFPLQAQTLVSSAPSISKASRKQKDALLEVEEAVFTDETTQKIAFAQKAIAEEDASLDDYIRHHQTSDTFHSFLFHLIDESGFTDADIYKRADIDRRHFSKIRSNPTYHPKKQTVLALCLALHLPEPTARYLLSLTGYSLSAADIGDLIFLFFLEKNIYNITEVNEALHYFGQPLLTST